jgi:hypothetical protein
MANIKEYKKNLEKTISEEIKKFENDTGTQIKSIALVEIQYTDVKYVEFEVTI